MNREMLFKAAQMDPATMPTNEVFRQTGRTTRMLEEAVATAKAGRKVLVVMKDQMMVRHTKQRIDDKHGRIDTLFIRGMSAGENTLFSWETLQGLGQYAEHAVYIDHDVIYQWNRKLFEAATKWDPKFMFDGDVMSFVRP